MYIGAIPIITYEYFHLLSIYQGNTDGVEIEANRKKQKSQKIICHDLDEYQNNN